MPMQYALALPQGGRAANPDLIRRTALQAEELGFSHVWVNDHITSPKGQESHISPFMFDPMMTAATAAAITSSIGVGIQLIAPYYEPLWLANALASLDTLSGGRVLASFGVGWSKDEFDALSSDFSTRGKRMDEILGIIRTAWSDDYVPVDTAHYHLPPVKIAPKPAHPIPLWVSGTSEPAYRRAVELGDGYHGHAVQDITIDNVAERVAQVRRSRPEESFTFSVYTWEWDLDRVAEERVMAERDAYEQAGVQHVVIALAGSDPDGRMQVTRRLAGLFGLSPR
jgi:probable F420-dependent oxidoreductase